VVTSGLARLAEILRVIRHVSRAPLPDSCTATMGGHIRHLVSECSKTAVVDVARTTDGAFRIGIAKGLASHPSWWAPRQVQVPGLVQIAGFGERGSARQEGRVEVGLGQIGAGEIGVG
jgi:hypothetical protein